MRVKDLILLLTEMNPEAEVKFPDDRPLTVLFSNDTTVYLSDLERN